MKHTAVFVVLVALLLCPPLRAEDPPASDRTVVGQIVIGRTLVVIPFEVH